MKLKKVLCGCAIVFAGMTVFQGQLRAEAETVSGWEQAGDYWMYYKDGVAQTGWQKIGSKWYFFDDSGLMRTGILDIEGKRYAFGKNGDMQIGWVYDRSDAVAYYEPDGHQLNVESWVRIGVPESDWYYAGKDGTLRTGWIQDGGKWYYLSEEDHWMMSIGTQIIDGDQYVFNDSGVLQTSKWCRLKEYYTEEWAWAGRDGICAAGWKTVSGKTYYFKQDEFGYVTMAHGEYIQGYWLNENGTWTYKYKASWHKDGTEWWYGDKNGWYAKNQLLRIDGVLYQFDLDGYYQEWKATSWPAGAKTGDYYYGDAIPEGALGFYKYSTDHCGAILKGYYVIVETDGVFYGKVLDSKLTGLLDARPEIGLELKFGEGENYGELCETLGFDYNWNSSIGFNTGEGEFYASRNLKTLQSKMIAQGVGAERLSGIYNVQPDSVIHLFNAQDQPVKTYSAGEFAEKFYYVITQ